MLTEPSLSLPRAQRPASLRGMVRWGLRVGGSVVLGLSLLVSGCGWLERAAGDPKQEAHYMQGENLRRSSMYVPAREAFQKAIEINPANYFAHQELGDLYYQYFNDPGTALYHYRRYLEIGQRVNGRTFTDPTTETCIQGSEFKLAERVVARLARERSTVELDQLKRENDALRQQLTEAQRQLQIRALEARNAVGTGAGSDAVRTPSGSGTTPPPPVNNPTTNRPPTRPTGLVQPEPPRVHTPPSTPTPPPAPAPRTYKVKSGDTPMTIARANGIGLPALLAANPGLDARRLKVGQTLQLPPK